MNKISDKKYKQYTGSLQLLRYGIVNTVHMFVQGYTCTYILRQRERGGGDGYLGGHIPPFFKFVSTNWRTVAK